MIRSLDHRPLLSVPYNSFTDQLLFFFSLAACCFLVLQDFENASASASQASPTLDPLNMHTAAAQTLGAPAVVQGVPGVGGMLNVPVGVQFPAVVPDTFQQLGPAFSPM